MDMHLGTYIDRYTEMYMEMYKGMYMDLCMKVCWMLACDRGCRFVSGNSSAHAYSSR